MDKGQILYKEAKRVIPGGTQLLSKRPELHLPGLWPPYYEKAKGCVVWDLNGRRYLDTSFMGVGSCILGYADSDVDRAVKKAIDKGSMTTLNCPEEVELAKTLCGIHRWAEMVRFARTGGEAMSIAVRIARAYTGKDIVLFCGYHGWQDWYLSANLESNKRLDGHLLPGLKPKGVPRALKDTAIPFNYNDLQGFLKLAGKYRGRIAAVVMEPVRNYYPKEGFLETIRKVTRRSKIVLIFDEITSGWRLNLGGAHLGFGVNPDIAVFAKAMSNGYPMAAIIGTGKVMSIAQETFISSTYWTERIGPAAAVATIKKLKECNVSKHLVVIGKIVQEGWNRLAKRHNLKIRVFGISPLSHFSFCYNNPLMLKTLFTQYMLEKGFLATDLFYVSYAHKRRDVESYLQATDEVFNFISMAVKKGDPSRYLKSGICQSGFKRLT